MHNEAALAADYANSALSAQPDLFVLTRIVGNDLLPRHAPGQSRENLRFILENEGPLADCEKRWVVNRIADPAEEERILTLLAEHRQPVLRVPFDPEEFSRIGWDTTCLSPGFLASRDFEALDPEVRGRLTLALYRLKNNYVMNNNGARNLSLEDGRTRAKWVLPWDGNCFIKREAWEVLRSAVRARPHLRYFLVPMRRVTDNAALLTNESGSLPLEEPQIVIRCDATERFDPEIPYGRRPKVELLWRLGVPGKWDVWRDDPWDRPRRRPSPEAGQFAVAGWVARLSSGRKALEREDDAGFKDRGRARQAAIVATIERLDAAIEASAVDSSGLLCYHGTALAGASEALQEEIGAEAKAALERGPFSVVDKTTLPPSGEVHDYWHPAPYWWPNPFTPSGRPYRQRDGVRVPGTRLYEPESDRYDRTRLQRLFDDTTSLTLAWRLGKGKVFAAHAALLLETWFVAPETRMTPHGRYAQVRLGWNGNEGVGTGIIEFKDFYYMLDAARLLEAGGALAPEVAAGLRDWLSAWRDWLVASSQGRRERLSMNNHGTCYDLQLAAITAYLDDRETLRSTLQRAQSRLTSQFAPEGSQPEELRRTATAHYCLFNLQSWMNLLRIGRRSGMLRPNFSTEPWCRLARGVVWLLDHDLAAWPYDQITPVDIRRILPVAASARENGIEIDPHTEVLSARAFAPPPLLYDPHDGVPPWWTLTHYAS